MYTALLSLSKKRNFTLNRSETKNPCFGQAVLEGKKLHIGMKLLKYKRSAMTSKHIILLFLFSLQWLLAFRICIMKIFEEKNKRSHGAALAASHVELAFLEANYPTYSKENSFLTQPSNDVGGSKLKERKALSLLLLEATLFDSDHGQQFYPFVLFLVFDGDQYQILPCPRFFHCIIRSLPFLCQRWNDAL